MITAMKFWPSKIVKRKKERKEKKKKRKKLLITLHLKT